MLNWGIIGTGRIAAVFIRALHNGGSGRPYMVCGRDEARTAQFAAENGVRAFVTEMEALLADSAVDAVYIATPHINHAELSLAALRAGKPVLCEKPMALDRESAGSVFETAREKNLLFQEAYMYRFHPQSIRLTELLDFGVVGEINTVESAFGFNAAPYEARQDRLFDPALGGGGVWDIGGYPLSLAILVANGAGEAVLSGGGVLYRGVDLSSAATVVFGGRIVARIACSLGATLNPALIIHGERGRITVPNPWVCDRSNPEEGLILLENESGKQEFRIPAVQTSFGYEADAFAAMLNDGIKSQLPMTESELLNRLQCRWRALVGSQKTT